MATPWTTPLPPVQPTNAPTLNGGVNAWGTTPIQWAPQQPQPAPGANTATSGTWVGTPTAAPPKYTSVAQPGAASNFFSAPASFTAQPVPPAWNGASAGSIAVPGPSTITKTNGALTTPGTYEQWYAANGHKFQQPTEAQNYWLALQGRYGAAGFQPTNTQTAYGAITSNFSQPSAGSTNARSVAGQLQQASQGEGYLNQAAGYFGGPNLTSSYAQGLDPRSFSAPGASESFYGSAAPQLAGQGAGESNVYSMMPEFRNRGAGEVNNDYVRDMLKANNNTQGFYNGMIGSGFVDANSAGSEFDYFRPQLRENSYSENLYESGNQGLNTFYDREYDKRSRRLQDQMAAMGVFGSGATGRGMYELEGELGAAQARDMASLAGQADQARLGRVGAAESFSKSAGAEQIARYGLGLQGATAADESTRGNATGMTNAAKIAQELQLDRLFKSGTLGLSADEAGRSRIDLAGKLAQNSDTAMLDRLKTGADIYDKADQSRFAQGEGLASVGNQLATQSTTRLNSSATAGLAADQEDRTRLNDMFKSATDLDAGKLSAEQFNAGLARNRDLDQINSLDRQGAAAQVSQTMFENRERYPMADQMAMATASASLVERAKSASAAEQTQIKEQIIQTLISGAGLSREQAQQQADEMFRAAGILTQGLGTAATNLKPAPAPVLPKPVMPVKPLNYNPFGS